MPHARNSRSVRQRSGGLVVTAAVLVLGAVTPAVAAASDADEELLGYAMEGEAEEVARLLAAGADPEAADEYGETALMFGASSSNVEVVRLLLEAGADPNRRNDDGVTALMAVVITDGETDVEEMYPLNTEVARALLEGGADKSVTDDEGRTALDLARDYGLAHMVALLE